MPHRDLITLFHIVGFLTGIALYGMLGVMTLRHRSRSSTSGGSAVTDAIPLATSALGLVWNIGALIAYGGRDLGIVQTPPVTVALAFTALGFLPAVVVHSAVQSLEPRPAGRRLVQGSYALSALAGVLQLVTAEVGSLPSRPALLALTYGYLGVILILAVLMRGQAGWRRALTAVALAAFSVMALHLGQHAETDSWWIELAGHHASLGLALVILYQDYRFALADLFLKRALTIVALIGVASLAHLWITSRFLLRPLAIDPTDPRATGALLAVMVAIALLAPALRRAVDIFVDRVILRRSDYRKVRALLTQRVSEMESPGEILDAAAESLKPALCAGTVRWKEFNAVNVDSSILVETRHGSQQVTVPVVTAEPPGYTFEIGALEGGRRILSDDLSLLESVAHIVARRIDSVRATQVRFTHAMREQQILQLATEAELRSLKAQLNPHFLFNALTTIGYLLQEAPGRALETLYALTGLLRAVLKRSDGDFTTLGEELEIVGSYLAIEKARFEERLTVSMDVPDAMRAYQVPALVLQPLVENAVKHGIAPRKEGGVIVVSARLEEAGGAGTALVLTVADTGVGVPVRALKQRMAEGVGLSNIEKRLERYFGSNGRIELHSVVGVGTRVEVWLPPTIDGRDHALAVSA